MAWDVKKGSKHYYCMISGGYVVTGTTTKEYSGKEQTAHTTFDQFLQDKEKQHDFIKKNLGENILQQTIERVQKIVENREKFVNANTAISTT